MTQFSELQAARAHARREMRHVHPLLAPPDTWEHAADGHVFRFRGEPLPAPPPRLGPGTVPALPCSD